MLELPLVSIIIRAYNQETYIAQAIQSAVNQTYQNIQIVIVDDNSSDGTPEILYSYSRKYPKVVEVYYNKKNIGELRNFNVALGYCSGDFVAILDGDDLYFPDKIKTQVERMQNHEQCAVCYHDAYVFKENLEDIFYSWSSRYGKREGNSLDLARFGPYPATASALFRKEFIPSDGQNEAVRTQGDWLMLIETVENSGGTINYIDEFLAGIRIHESNVSHNWPNKLYSRFKTIEIANTIYPHLKQHLYAYESDLRLIESLYYLSRIRIYESVKSFIKAIIKSFPNVLTLLRIPIRELIFFIKNGEILHPFESRIIE